MPGELGRRATIAYNREAIRHGAHPPRPLVPATVAHQGTTYVVLRHGPALLAIYKVLKSNGRLKRLHRWPAALEDASVRPA